MVLCIAVCSGLGLGMLVLRKKAVWQKVRSPCRVLLLFGLFGILADMAASAGTGGDTQGQIKRKAPGEGELETEVCAYLPQENTEYTFTITIPERKYQKLEEQDLLIAAEKELKETFCGKNTSMEQIVFDPNVSESYQNGAVEAEWSFSERSFISAEGKIDTEAVKKSGIKKQKAEAVVLLRCGESEKTCCFAFWIVPEEKSRRESVMFEVEEQIAAQEETEAFVTLPDYAGGHQIRWKTKAPAHPAEFLGLGILAAAAVFYAQKEQHEKKREKRKRSLLLTYPEFVSKLSLLLGAGMTISGALRKMEEMYQKRKAKGAGVKAVYEELHYMICEMDNGMGELRAYQEFGERCDLQPYRKLVSLMTSGQRIGNRRLLEQLNEEADRVFLERKNAARRLGEEAGTKLLLPMMLMLVVIMGIVMVPAFLSIYGI